jgi:hypothetical protein
VPGGLTARIPEQIDAVERYLPPPAAGGPDEAK